MLRRPLAHTRRSSRSKTLKREVDAKKFLISVEHSKDTNTYIDPSRSKVKTGPFARDSWLVGKAHLKPSTRARYVNILDHHIVPRWGDTPLYAVGHADVQKWISSIDLAPASVRYVHRVLSLIMELAVRDGRIPSNPTTGVRLPKVAKSEKRFLTAEELHRLADAAAQYPIPEVGQQYRALILLLGFCGPRWGEVAALRVKRVDPAQAPPHGCRVGDRGARPTGMGNTEVAPIPLGAYPPVACATAR